MVSVIPLTRVAALGISHCRTTSRANRAGLRPIGPTPHGPERDNPARDDANILHDTKTIQNELLSTISQTCVITISLRSPKTGPFRVSPGSANVSGAFPRQEGGPDRSTSLSDRPMTREKWTDNGAESWKKEDCWLGLRADRD